MLLLITAAPVVAGVLFPVALVNTTENGTINVNNTLSLAKQTVKVCSSTHALIISNKAHYCRKHL